MAEHPLASPLRGGGGAVTPGADLDRTLLRCRPDAVPAISAELGLELPMLACRATATDRATALWLGPDEWLLLRDPGAPALRLPEGVAGSVVNVSHRQVAVVVEGPRAEQILASGCPLDLSADAFPVGACTRTLFHKAEVVLWRTAPRRFHVEVWRSFARYVEALLIEADRER